MSTLCFWYGRESFRTPCFWDFIRILVAIVVRHMKTNSLTVRGSNNLAFLHAKLTEMGLYECTTTKSCTLWNPTSVVDCQIIARYHCKGINFHVSHCTLETGWSWLANNRAVSRWKQPFLNSCITNEAIEWIAGFRTRVTCIMRLVSTKIRLDKMENVNSEFGLSSADRGWNCVWSWRRLLKSRTVFGLNLRNFWDPYFLILS